MYRRPSAFLLLLPILSLLALGVRDAPAQVSYGPDLGRLYLSFDPNAEQTCQAVSTTNPDGDYFTVYVMADVDFADIGMAGRNSTDGLSAWEATVVFEDQPDLDVFRTNISYPSAPGSVDLGEQQAIGGDAYHELIVGTGECLDVSQGPVVLAALEFVAAPTGGIIEDVKIRLEPAQVSSFTGAPNGDGPGWVECLPFDEVRFPFADWQGNDLTLNPTTVDLEATSVAPLTTVSENCGPLDVEYSVANLGCNLSGPFEVSLWLSDDDVITTADRPLGTFLHDPGAEPFVGEVRTVTLPGAGLPSDAYLGLIVDAPDAVAETDETNNVASSPLTLEGHQLLSVQDVPDDQGLQVRLNFSASLFDVAGSATPILQYEIFRRIDLPKMAIDRGEPPEGRISALDKTPGFEFVGAVPAHAESEYNAVAPTLKDSVLPSDPQPAGFFVRAATADPATYYDSCVVEGMSTDDLAPPPPGAFSVAYSASGNALSWQASDAPDVVSYRIYRTSEAGGSFSKADLVHETDALQWFDDTADPFAQSYQIGVTDDGGNESQPGEPGSVTGVGPDGSDVPSRFALEGNVPNPFNPSTVIAFDVPRPGHVELVIFDASGRRVRTLRDERMEEGTYSVTWDGRDDGGREVGSGIYIYRLMADGFSRSRKMALVR